MTKRIINLMIAVLFTSFTAMASSTPTIFIDGSKTFIVDTKAWKTEFLSVEIIDSNGEIILEEKYSTVKSKKFNFENLPLGTYTISLENELKSTKQNFEIRDNDIILLAKEETVFKPVIQTTEGHIDLNFLANSNPTLVTIYAGNKKIYSTKFVDSNSIHKRFNINDLSEGSYTFSVVSGDNVYAKRFKK